MDLWRFRYRWPLPIIFIFLIWGDGSVFLIGTIFGQLTAKLHLCLKKIYLTMFIIGNRSPGVFNVFFDSRGIQVRNAKTHISKNRYPGGLNFCKASFEECYFHAAIYQMHAYFSRL